MNKFQLNFSTFEASEVKQEYKPNKNASDIKVANHVIYLPAYGHASYMSNTRQDDHVIYSANAFTGPDDPRFTYSLDIATKQDGSFHIQKTNRYIHKRENIRLKKLFLHSAHFATDGQLTKFNGATPKTHDDIKSNTNFYVGNLVKEASHILEMTQKVIAHGNGYLINAEIDAFPQAEKILDVISNAHNDTYKYL